MVETEEPSGLLAAYFVSGLSALRTTHTAIDGPEPVEIIGCWFVCIYVYCMLMVTC